MGVTAGRVGKSLCRASFPADTLALLYIVCYKDTVCAEELTPCTYDRNVNMTWKKVRKENQTHHALLQNCALAMNKVLQTNIR